MGRRKIITLLALLVAGGLAWVLWPAPVAYTSGSMEQEAYVWQRVWTQGVHDAVKAEAPSFSRLVVLGAEVSWKNGAPIVVKANMPYETGLKINRPVGVALRIGPYSGPFDEGDANTRRIVAAAAKVVSDAKAAGMTPAELQIDFDCAESKLDGYRQWVVAIRKAVGQTPVTITVLPSWLNGRGFDDLVKSTDGYVLQVHSLERPKDADSPLTLCDVEGAKRSVEKAAQAGVPFRVALPTYGYILAFDAHAKFLGLFAEDRRPEYPPGGELRQVKAEPGDMAALVREWTARRPAAMQGVIWYRLPTDDDRMNWRWPTLAAVMEGRTPKADLRVSIRRPSACLYEVDLTNAGETDLEAPARVWIEWPDATLVADDPLGGYGRIEHEDRRACIVTGTHGMPEPFRPGDKRTIAWMRFDRDTEVNGYVR